MRLLGLLKLPECTVFSIMIQLQGYVGGMWWFEGKWYPKLMTILGDSYSHTVAHSLFCNLPPPLFPDNWSTDL